ncbi:MAG TPA: HPF/RaiA family ribosome-associated protein [Rhodothermales bacterium]|nr:HPF/RaiA family ribosome-associated protein [Rhodothermales bacterium]
MQTTRFDVAYHSETPEFTDQLKDKVEKCLGKLAHGAKDIKGASVAICGDGGDSDPSLYRVRITLQQRAGQAMVVEKGGNVATTLNRALNTLERQVREKREKRRSIQRRQGNTYKA